MKSMEAGALISTSSMLSSEWRKPFNLSIGLHIVVVITAILATIFFERQPRLPEIYTVNLYTATEASITPPPVETPATKQPETQKVRQIEPEVKKPVISIQPSKPEVSPTAPKAVIKPISLRPVKIKMKVGKTIEEEAVEKAKLSKVINRIKANAAEKEAKERAEKAARDAVSKLADSLKATTPKTPVTTTANTTGQAAATLKSAVTSGPRGTGIEPEFYMKQYLATINGIIQGHYILSKHLQIQNLDKELEVIIWATVYRDGSMTDIKLKKGSNNLSFNKSTIKAVEAANPLPPFPSQLKEEVLEVGFRFRPEGLY